MQRIPLPVPDILGHSDELGIVALQDLGDVTLQAHLGAASPSEHAALYRQAVALIEQLQRRGAELESDAFVPYRIAFDVEKLTWELDFFAKHFVEGYRGAALTPAERAALAERVARRSSTSSPAEPRVLCHRDYHSRNLMLRDGSLYIIDFQDARMGPDTYDLVSLLRDSYVDIADRELDELIAYFLALKRATARQARHDEEFRRRFDLMALQRNLKALGTFGYQTLTRRNTVYIQYIPRTLRYAKTNLAKYPRVRPASRTARVSRRRAGAGLRRWRSTRCITGDLLKAHRKHWSNIDSSASGPNGNSGSTCTQARPLLPASTPTSGPIRRWW